MIFDDIFPDKPSAPSRRVALQDIERAELIDRFTSVVGPGGTS